MEEPRSDEYIIVLLEIQIPQSTTVIRVANDVVDYVYNGNTYIGFPFEIELVGDVERMPRGTLRIQNVDQRIGEAVLELVNPPRLAILLFAQSDFEPTEVGGRTRNELSGGIQPEYEARNLVFGNVSVDAVNLSGEILSFDMSNEPWPAIRSTAERLPGLDP